MTWEELREEKRQAGGVVGVPEIQHLAEMYTVRRSAAD